MTTVTKTSALASSNSAIRSVGAVLAGLVTVVAGSSAIDAILHATGIYPAGPNMAASLYVVAVAYRSAIQIAGGWITGRLSPRNPRAHVAVLAGIGTVGALGGVAAATDGTLGPLWYPLMLLVLAIPTVVAGGRLAGRQVQLR